MKLMADDPAMMLRAGPGTVVPWVRWLITCACVITIASLAIGGRILIHELAWEDEESMGQWWLRSGVAWFATIAIVSCVLPGSKLSRFVHAAIALPIVHAIVVWLGWFVWQHQMPTLSSVSDGRAFASWFPFAKVTLVAIPLTALVAALIARRRKGEWPHAFVMLALAQLLLVGLWLPIGLEMFGRAPDDFWVTTEYWRAGDQLLPHPLRMAFVVTAPAVLAAIGYTLLAVRRAGWLRAHRKGVVIATSVLIAVAMLVRMNAEARPMVLYSNFVPLLLVGVLVAVSALLALAVSMLVRGYQLRRKFAARERMVGVIVAETAEPVFGLEIPSWLRGPRMHQRPFAIATATGTIPVTGAELVAPLPATTTLLGRDEVLGLIHPGDTVVVAGQMQDEAGPFRTSSAPLAGALYVAPADVERAGLTSAVLAMWRPCVAYLLIITAVALPGLAALLGD